MKIPIIVARVVLAALNPLVAQLKKLAAKTPTPADDAVVAGFEQFLSALEDLVAANSSNPFATVSVNSIAVGIRNAARNTIK